MAQFRMDTFQQLRDSLLQKNSDITKPRLDVICVFLLENDFSKLEHLKGARHPMHWQNADKYSPGTH